MSGILGRRSRDPFAPTPVGRWMLGAGILVTALVTAFPFYAMLVMSLKRDSDLDFPESLLPWNLDLGAYQRLLGANDIGLWFFNTLIYSGVSTVLTLALAALAGFGFAKSRFPGSKAMFWAILAMLMIPFHATLIPTFMLISRLGGTNTYWGLIIPTLANATAVFLMRQFIAATPPELVDAARIDGASDIQIFWRVILPLCRPVLATLGLFVFLWHWNDLLWPLVVGTDSSMKVITTGVAGMQSLHVSLNQMLAGAVLALVPVFVVYLFAQRSFVEGVSQGAVKG